MTGFADPIATIRDLAEMLRPPRRLTVAEAAEQHVILDTPGGYSGRWSSDLPYYMVQPAEELTNRSTQAVIFVGPAQSAKTQMLVDNWAAHMISCDPSDMMVVQTAQDTARDFSKRRIDRMLDASPSLREKLRPGGSSDNTFDKQFRSGAILTLGWPTKNQLAGKAIGKLALTDYDRMPEDVDGEGPAFTLAMKRTTTFLSRGMTMAESSPSKPIIDPKWKRKSPHEAPPTKGILGLYNSGDRRMIYGKCPHCGEYFAPAASIEAMQLGEGESIEAQADSAQLVCTASGCLIDQSLERVFKRSGIWLKEGQRLEPDGTIHGDGRQSRRASFWLPGWFAAFQSWSGIVYNYLSARANYERTGDEEALKGCVNTDMSAPYLYEAQRNDSAGIEDDWKERAEELERYQVPEGVRTLIATVDVQAGKNARFEVQVTGYGVGGEKWIVDRYALRKSARTNPDGTLERIDPGAYAEDWDLLTERVVNGTYQLPDGQELRVFKTACDSGGSEGVTENAYAWWRRLKRQNLHGRVLLVKGASGKTAPRIHKSYPDTRNRKDRNAGSAGDVPVWLLNTNMLKDAVWQGLTRNDPGPGYVHFPQWLPGSAYAELVAETRTANGWIKPGGHNNESFDLMVYAQAVWIDAGGEAMNWDIPKPWARAWHSNPDVMSRDARLDMKTNDAPRRVAQRRNRMRAR